MSKNSSLSQCNLHSLPKNGQKHFSMNGYKQSYSNIIDDVNNFNNTVPAKMQKYNFNTDGIDGELYYLPNGKPLFIREDDKNVTRDYYISYNKDQEYYTIARILEHDKSSGRLHSKIEQINKEQGRLRTNVTVFDLQKNNKYTVIQLAEDGTVCNISEYTRGLNSFHTIFRNPKNNQPTRYIEGHELKEGLFEIIDCLFNLEGDIVRMKKYSKK